MTVAVKENFFIAPSLAKIYRSSAARFNLCQGLIGRQKIFLAGCPSAAWFYPPLVAPYISNRSW